MNSKQINFNKLEALEIDDKNISTKVDINLIMSRIKKEENKKKKENFVLVSLISSVVLVTGIIASL
tara:strand:- start:153 stop:350 length:198 start_codon:yes stop_codon:yes gene_type:complete